jgi:hypothetical protein
MTDANNTLPLPGYAFWDVNRESLDFARDKEFIVSRMFERGKLDDVLSLITFYGQNEAGRLLRSNKHLNRQGLYLAHTLLGVPLNDFKAYATSKLH